MRTDATLTAMRQVVFLDLNAYVQQVVDGLRSGSGSEPDDGHRAALDPAVRLAIIAALSDAANALNEQLDGTSLHVEVEGRDVRVAINVPS